MPISYGSESLCAIRHLALTATVHFSPTVSSRTWSLPPQRNGHFHRSPRTSLRLIIRIRLLRVNVRSPFASRIQTSKPTLWVFPTAPKVPRASRKRRIPHCRYLSKNGTDYTAFRFCIGEAFRSTLFYDPNFPHPGYYIDVCGSSRQMHQLPYVLIHIEPRRGHKRCDVGSLRGPYPDELHDFSFGLRRSPDGSNSPTSVLGSMEFAHPNDHSVVSRMEILNIESRHTCSIDRRSARSIPFCK